MPVADRYCFSGFELDRRERRLLADGEPVDLNARYLDVLLLMVERPGSLIDKSRFMDEVWKGVPVTDEALTQAIRTLRRALGDSASNPRFIETVPRHGYRFIAAVEPAGEPVAEPTAEQADEIAADVSPAPREWPVAMRTTFAGMAGGGVAGLLGGLFYGLILASQPTGDSGGGISILLVTLCLTMFIATLGASGVSAGIGVAARAALGQRWLWMTLGGAIGGALLGTLFTLVAVDAFNLLIGTMPRGITGGYEGALLGAAVGFAAWLGPAVAGRQSVWGAIMIAAAVGAVAGLGIVASGGNLWAGSIDLLVHEFPAAKLPLGKTGTLFTDSRLELLTAAMEGALFTASIVGAIILASSKRDAPRP